MKALLLLFFIPQAFAGVMDSFSCSRQVTQLATEWKATGEWRKQYQGGLKDFFYASPTSKVGEWVLAKDLKDGAVTSKVSQDGRVEVVLDGKTCAKKSKAYPHPKPKSGYKTDKDIAEFVEKNKKGAIYVWSPRMILSKKGIPEIKAAAANLKLPLLILLDKDLSESEYQKLQKELGPLVTQRVDSLEFKMREVEQHFPALFVFKNTKIFSGM
jgi:hypothetical protein